MKLKPIVPKNKKGNIIGLVFFFFLLFAILVLGVIMIFASSTINWVFDTAVPEITNLGVIGDANMTQIAGLTITPLNNIIQNFTWFTGVLYALMIIGSIGFAYASRVSPSKWLMGFYFLLIVLLILGSIILSNMYEDVVNTGDSFATILQEHTILHYGIIYSPMIFTVIAFFTGIIMFSGREEEEFI